MCWSPVRKSSCGPGSKWCPERGHHFLQGWCQHISHAGMRIFEGMGCGIFDVEQQSLIMDKNQIDIHRVINK